MLVNDPVPLKLEVPKSTVLEGVAEKLIALENVPEFEKVWRDDPLKTMSAAPPTELDLAIIQPEPSEKFPFTFKVPVPGVAVEFRFRVDVPPDVEWLKLPVRFTTHEPVDAIVCIDVAEFAMVKFPAMLTILPVPEEEKTILEDPSTRTFPAIFVVMDDALSNSLNVRDEPPVCETVRLPLTVVRAPPRLIKAVVVPPPIKFGQFQVK